MLLPRPRSSLLSAVLILAGTILMIAGGFFLASFVRDQSTSIVMNFAFTLLWGIVLMAVSALEASLVISLIYRPQKQQEEDDGDRIDLPPSLSDTLIRDLNFPQGAALLVCVLINLLVTNWITGGFFIRENRANGVVTMLRSPDIADRLQGIDDSIVVPGERVTDALCDIASSPGRHRQGALWALGMRKHEPRAGILEDALENGTAEERNSAALAIARLRVHSLLDRLMQLATSKETSSVHLVMALALLSDPPDPAKFSTAEQINKTAEDRMKIRPECEALEAIAADKDRDIRQRAAAIWGLRRMEYGPALDTLLEIIKPGNPVQLRCAAVMALGRIGHADGAMPLVGILKNASEKDSCELVEFEDYGKQTFSLAGGADPLQVKILHNIARIGNRSVRTEMDKISKNESFTKRVRYLAGELAGQLR